MRNNDRRAEPAPAPEPPVDDITVAFTPRQLAAGAAIIAAIVLLIANRRRRNR
jgi:hypothetical protein